MESKTSKYLVCVLFGGVSTEYSISLRSAYNVIGNLRQAGHEVMRVGISPEGQWLLFNGDDEDILKDRWLEVAQLDAAKATELKSTIEPKSAADTEGRFSKSKDSTQDNSARRHSPLNYILSITDRIPDLIFPIVHGINCEDGILQGLLELTGIPYVGCNVTASAVGMDKRMSRELFKAAGIPVCKYLAVNRDGITHNFQGIAKETAEYIGYPCFIKPNNGGSSVGTCKVNGPEELEEALLSSSNYDYTILIEEWVDAREIEIAVLGNDQPIFSMPGEIIKADNVDYYDYKTKYLDTQSSYLQIPADISEEDRASLESFALKAYKTLGCSGLSRIDFFLDKRDGRILLNEINTIPGFTSISLYPKAWELSGVAGPELVTRLCNYALDYKASRQKDESFA